MLKLSLLVISEPKNAYSVEALWSDTDISLPLKRQMSNKGTYYFHSSADLFESIISIFDRCEVDTLNLLFEPDNTENKLKYDVQVLTGQVEGNKNKAVNYISSEPETRANILRFFRSQINITVY